MKTSSVKWGTRKEHRVDPQVVIGLLVDSDGFPLEIHCFDGAKPETFTLIPVLQAFQKRHHVTDLVVAAAEGGMVLDYAGLRKRENSPV